MTKRGQFEQLFTELTGIAMSEVRRDEFGYFWIPPEINPDTFDQDKYYQLSELAGAYQRGKIDDTFGIGGIWMRPPHPEPQKGAKVIRHEFRETHKKGGSAYVVFDGAEDTPFWDRPNDGIRFVYTDLNYRHNMHLVRKGELVHTTVECDGSEFSRYRDEAERLHEAARQGHLPA